MDRWGGAMDKRAHPPFLEAAGRFICAEDANGAHPPLRRPEWHLVVDRPWLLPFNALRTQSSRPRSAASSSSLRPAPAAPMVASTSSAASVARMTSLADVPRAARNSSRSPLTLRQ